MNLFTLRQWCRDSRISETEAMNRLQDAGIISDNCVWFADIYVGDIPAAIKYLNENTGQPIPR